VKKYLIVLILVLFTVPSIALASWWNPGSWFRKDYVETTKITPLTANTSNSRSSVPTSTIPIVQPVATKVIYDTKIIEKPVIKTVTVQDPVLQKQINDLIADNLLLKQKMEELIKKIENKEKELEQLKSVPVFSKVEECEKAQAIIDAFTEKYSEVTAREKKATEEIIKKAGESHGAITQADVDVVKNKYKAEKSALAKEVPLARSKQKLYCE
jgi:hypothetical protein